MTTALSPVRAVAVEDERPRVQVGHVEDGDVAVGVVEDDRRVALVRSPTWTFGERTPATTCALVIRCSGA
jgi:hypothetical protein